MTLSPSQDFPRDEFLDVLAHELRTPLAPLRNGLQILRMARGDVQLQEETLDVMERQMQRLVSLIDGLLDASRVYRGGIELHREKVALASIIQTAVDGAQPRLEGHPLELRLPTDSVFLRVDVARITQVFSHLIDNAVKYSGPGGAIAIVAERDGEMALVSVRDSGIGISSDVLPHVFEMFGPSGRSLEQPQAGLRLGLAIVRRLVEMHGGSVEARSNGPGAGSQFLVRLPVFREEGTWRPASDISASLPGGDSSPGHFSRCRVLVVDDDADCAGSLALMLRVMGHEVRTACDGMDTLRVAAGFHPGVILLDLGMPKLNGYDTCRIIREQPWAREVIMVAVTGWGDDEDRRRSHEAGFDYHLVKPVDITAFQKITENVFS